MNEKGRNTKMTEKCNCDKDEKQTWLISVIDGIVINSEAQWGNWEGCRLKGCRMLERLVRLGSC